MIKRLVIETSDVVFELIYDVKTDDLLCVRINGKLRQTNNEQEIELMRAGSEFLRLVTNALDDVESMVKQRRTLLNDDTFRQALHNAVTEPVKGFKTADVVVGMLSTTDMLAIVNRLMVLVRNREAAAIELAEYTTSIAIMEAVAAEEYEIEQSNADPLIIKGIEAGHASVRYTWHHRAEHNKHLYPAEQEHNIILPTIVEALKSYQAAHRLKQKNMAAALGMPDSHYSEVMHGNRSLPYGAVKKAYKMGIPAAILLQE